MTQVEVLEAQLDDKTVIRSLLELYQYDFSELDGADVDDHGSYGYLYLDHYWTEDSRRPFLFRADEHWVGFALIALGDPNDVREFFVLRKYRRRGIGQDAARAVFKRFPGAWQVRQIAGNIAATTFWRQAIPVDFEEGTTENGLVQRFVVPGER